jgi:uncharacterized protein YkwD
MRGVVLLAMFFASMLIAVVDSPPASASRDLASAAQRIVELTNQQRAKAGLLPLKWNDTLAAAATSHAQDMAERGYLAHTSPEGSTAPERARAAGYAAYGSGHVYVGENLARAYYEPEALVQAWMDSPGHRQNILWAQYREIGVGVAVRSNGTLYWAQVFGSRPMALPLFINGDATETLSREVTLSITSEEVSNWGSLDKIASVMISNGRDFSGAAWAPYSPVKQWTLRNQAGVQRVYVRLMDSIGNIVEISDEIVLRRDVIQASNTGAPSAALARLAGR